MRLSNLPTSRFPLAQTLLDAWDHAQGAAMYVYYINEMRGAVDGIPSIFG